MPRYESGTADNRRFWEISVLGNQVRTRHGRVGTDGRLGDAKVFPSETEARKDADKRIAGRVRQGFESVDDDTTGQAYNPDLVNAIADNPDDDGAYLVYGDWLQSQGDPRGELVVVQQQLASAPEDKALHKAQDKLLATLAPTRVTKMAKKKRAAKKSASGYTELSWRLGFIDRARVARNSDRPPYTVRELVASLLNHPAAQVLRSLTVGALGVKGQYDYAPVIEEIRLAAPRSLRELFIADFDLSEHADLSGCSLGDVSGLYPVLPRLESLHLRAGSLTLGDMALPSLRALTITTGLFEESALDAVAKAPWPKLVSLRLEDGGTALPIAGAVRLLTAKLECLRELALVGTDDTGDLFRGGLRGTPLLARLRVLDLSHGSLSDQDATTMLAERHQLEHLQTLNLEANHLSEDVAAELVGICPDVRVAGQRPRRAVQISDQQIVEFAPDSKSIVAARKIAKPGLWPVLGRDGTILWGSCQGSSLYDVYMDVDAMESGCTCPSQKYPCKHAIALLILAQSHPLPAKEPPPGFVDTVEESRYDSVWE